MSRNIYVYSQLSSESARQLILSHYKFRGTPHCQFYVLGLHDNYLIEDGDTKYILRIYRNNWRTPMEINFELELLAFLGKQSTPVAYPIATMRGDLAFSIDSPEGERIAALFHYADGYAPGATISTTESELLGRTVANIHDISDTFTTNHTRQELELSYLLDDPVVAIKPFVNSKEHAYLSNLQKKLHRHLPKIKKEAGMYGICIGDVNPTNFHINQDKQITLFDFYQCGYGYRAFEIGKFFFFDSLSSRKTDNRRGVPKRLPENTAIKWG